MNEFRLIAIVGLATVSIACSPDAPTAPETATASPGAAFVAARPWSERSNCSPAGAVSPKLHVGDALDYAVYRSGGDRPGAQYRQVVERISGNMVEVTRSIASLDRALTTKPKAKLDTVVAGLLPGPVGGGKADEQRIYAYPADAAARIGLLKKGETLRLPTTETSIFAGVRREVSGEVVITYLGCGDIALPGGAEFVRLFAVAQPGRRYDDRSVPKTDEVLTSRRWVYLSDRLGWPVRTQGMGGTVSELLRAPALSSDATRNQAPVGN